MSGERMFTTARLHVRSEPNTASRSLRVLQAGTPVSALERSQEWARISDGWVSLRYLASENGGVTARREVPLGTTMKRESEPIGGRESGLW
jgi:SH3-like domain-containing protein